MTFRNYAAIALFLLALSSGQMSAQTQPAPDRSLARESTPAAQSPEKNKQEQDQNEGV